MPEILIIGASAAGFSACRQLAEAAANLNITILTDEKCLPYRRDRLPDLIEGKLKKKDIFLCAESYFKLKNIRFIADSRVSNVDFKKQRVALRTNHRFAYDYLIIASGRRLRLEIPGRTKEGVIIFNGISDAEGVQERLKIPGSVAVSGDSNCCRRIAEFFVAKGREVKLFGSAASQIDSGSRDNLELFEKESIQELIGEGKELKAAKLNSGKIIGVSSVVFCGSGEPCLDFASGGPLFLDQGYIQVDEKMSTNLENVFACGAVCRLEQPEPARNKNWQDAVNEGIKAAETILELSSRLKQSTVITRHEG